MPWQETNVVDKRTEFVLRALRDVERFGDVCREFGISRKTGYKWKQRFLEDGLAGLGDQSRRPENSPGGIGEAMVCQIVKLRGAHPTWGARKLRAVLERTAAKENVPSESSIKRILDKAGLVEHRRRVPTDRTGRVQTPVKAERPNHIWTIDFKGWWYTQDRHRCLPLTIRDDFSRYLLCTQTLDDAGTEAVRRQFENVFECYGLPEVIRSDNGPPFAASNAPLGLSRLSAWWLSLGINLDRIQPGRPDQNGGHERMHRDIAREVEAMASSNIRTQQAELDVWRKTFNEERPHEALNMRMPQEVYRPSSRKFDRTPVELTYPATFLRRKVTSKGYVKIHGQPILITTALTGWPIGLESLEANRLAVWYCQLCLGQVDLSMQKFRPATEHSATAAS